jgi:hypothetical protein
MFPDVGDDMLTHMAENNSTYRWYRVRFTGAECRGTNCAVALGFLINWFSGFNILVVFFWFFFYLFIYERYSSSPRSRRSTRVFVNISRDTVVDKSPRRHYTCHTYRYARSSSRLRTVIHSVGADNDAEKPYELIV